MVRKHDISLHVTSAATVVRIREECARVFYNVIYKGKGGKYKCLLSTCICPIVMGRTKDVSSFVCGQVAAYHEQGLSQRVIARKLKISRCPVQNALKKDLLR